MLDSHTSPAPGEGTPGLSLISHLLAFLQLQGTIAHAQGLTQQLQMAHAAALQLLSQLLDDGTTALCLPFGDQSDSARPAAVLGAVEPREHGREDVEKATVLGASLPPGLLGQTAQVCFPSLHSWRPKQVLIWTASTDMKGLG